MFDSEEKTSGKGGKHIKFAREDLDDVGIGQTSRREADGGTTPKHDLEVERFHAKTLEDIRVFKEARKRWMLSTSESEVGIKAVDKTMYTLEIDRRRIHIMKKLGIKISLIRPHRNTLRPRVYFTCKKSLTMRELEKGQAELEARNAAKNKKDKLALKKSIIKRAKKAARRKKKNKIEADGRKDSRGETLSKAEELKKAAKKKDILAPLEADEREDSRWKTWQEAEDGKTKDLKEVSTTQDEYRYGTGKEEESKLKRGRDGKRTPAEGEEMKQEQDDPSSESREEFRKLEKSPRDTTEIEVDEKKAAWREKHPPSIEKRVTIAEDVEEPPDVKTKSRHSNAFKWFRKKRRIPQEKKKRSTPSKSEFRPCLCQFVEGEGVIIVKNVCDCSGKLEGAKTVIVKSSNADGTVREIPVVADEDAKSNFNVEKVVDSLEMIRTKLSSTSLPVLKDREGSDVTVKTTSSAKSDVTSQNTAGSALGEYLSDETIYKTKQAESKTKSRRKTRDGKVSTKGKHSVLGEKKKTTKEGSPHVSFGEVRFEEPNDESSNKVTKTVMSVVNIFRRYS